MKKDYCTQNNGDCQTCSLVNYGLDCRNIPLPVETRRGTKRERMMAAYDGFKGDQTVQAVLAQIPDELMRKLTGKQLGLVMSAINRAYHNGRASTGAEVIDGDMVWINCLKRMYDIKTLRNLSDEEK